eukprot:2694951-Pyramimonas_sp.AAC.1
MRFLRAAETSSMGTLSTCMSRYPRLREFLDNLYDTACHTTRLLQPVRDHAVDLAREHALDELGKAT